MSASDPRSILVEALRSEPEKFQLSNLILGKKGPKAIFQLYGLKADLLKFAYDPKAAPMLPKMPQLPAFEDGMTQEEMKGMTDQYRELMAYWKALKEAHELKVPLNDYMHIMDYLTKYFMALYSTPALKGARFHAFTKRVDEPAQRGGFLSKLGMGRSAGSNTE